MRIGIVNEYFPPFTPGGAEWSTLYLATQLAQHADIEKVVVITPNHGALPYEEFDGFIVERFPFPFKLDGARNIHLHGLLSNPLFYLYSASQVIRLVHKHRLDLLHAHNKQISVGSVWAAHWLNIPVVITLRDLMILCRYGMCLNDFDVRTRVCDSASYVECLRSYLALYMPDIGLARRTQIYLFSVYHRVDSLLKRATLAHADAVITISKKLRTIYVACGVDPSRIQTIYNPIANSAIVPKNRQGDPSSLRILYAGKLSWGKGTHLLVEALPSIRDALAPAKIDVWLVGQGPLRGHLERRVVELGLSDIVTFKGQIPQDKLHEIYRTASLVVVPSVVQEAFGRVALEALMAGAPVVVSDHGGLAEIVDDGDTGIVAAPRPESLASASIRVLRAHNEFRARVHRAQPRLRHKFGMDVTQQHVDVYQSLLRHAQTPGRGTP